MDASTFASLLMDLNEERKEALLDLIQAARSIDADLSFNSDARGLMGDGHCRIEAPRVRRLLDAIHRLDSPNAAGVD